MSIWEIFHFLHVFLKKIDSVKITTKSNSGWCFIVTCLQTYEEAAQQAAVSRLYGGIHISIDNDDGLRLGRRLGENVAGSLAWLSPERYRTKGGSCCSLERQLLHFLGTHFILPRGYWQL
jgi:hypothetical protein